MHEPSATQSIHRFDWAVGDKRTVGYKQLVSLGTKLYSEIPACCCLASLCSESTWICPLLYYTLANTDLSLAVPACNALSLVFSIFTSWNIGEPIDQPLQTLFGASLIVGGVVICLRASSNQEFSPDTEGQTFSRES